MSVQTVDVARELGLVVVAPCAGGEFGATHVRGVDGRDLVLKLVHDLLWATRGADIAGRVRARGYPAPEYVGVGTVGDQAYTLQERRPGEIPEVLTVDYADQLLDLLPMHAGVVPEGTGWVEELVSGLRGDGGWPTHDAAREVAPAVVDELVALGQRLDALPLTEHDAVHGDFHFRNYLAVDGQVTTVFDWEGARNGDCRFDAFVLAYWARAVPDHAAPDAAARAWDRATAGVEPDALALFAGHMALRNLDFYARHNPQALPWCLATVDEILAPCWR